MNISKRALTRLLVAPVLSAAAMVQGGTLAESPPTPAPLQEKQAPAAPMLTGITKVSANTGAATRSRTCLSMIQTCGNAHELCQ